MAKNMAFYIQKDCLLYSPGDLVTGCVNLKTLRPLYVSRIELRMCKRFMAVYRQDPLNKTMDDQDESASEKILYEKNFTLYKNPLEFDEISSGHHTFPFQIQLKTDDNGSVNTQICFESGCYKIKNQYLLETTLYMRESCRDSVICKQSEVYIVDKTRQDHIKATRVHLSYCFCLFSSNCLLETVLDKKVYFSGDIARLRIFIKESKSKIKIKGVVTELYQLLETEISGIRVFDQKLISKTKGYSDTPSDSFLADIRIPFTVPSNVTERYLKLKNLLYISVCFDMSLPVRIQKSISVVKNQLQAMDDDVLEVLDGVKQPIQFFKI